MIKLDQFRKEIIKVWFNRAKKHINGTINGFGNQPIATQLFYVDGLIYCTITYEAYLFGMFAEKTVKNNRKNLDRKFGNILKDSNLPDDLKNAINELYKETNINHIKDMSGRSRRFVWVKNKDDLDNILDVIYRIRSNLLHGGKELSNDRNFKLIKYSFIALYRILEIILKHEGLIC